ncbi:Eukaryotic translation initiation factor 3 subunit F [Pestalotiopsis fici W106-1]|uniref:Eukaryotic translation initiation factor 3 subunit F n=1 Tax=Pestalotiopsis fici (strain W106-1 / CGMCC3.15140) TaxID=1229662 RepID=W3X756_PESFW|nr:Eukaryotic translation initiation factor 3 subunit F [Pestalotiopsis fici W106-1]ETS81011.1 Eukaryotic translation initiation factor 3 subunit F [Pestalotiopsis fici W106-1]
MAVDTETFLHLSRPLAPTVNLQSSIAPLSVNIQPQAILSILDHAVRRDPPATPTTSSRVIGALIGSRNEDGSEVSVSSTFAIPHTENEDQVEVDVEYQKNMLNLHLKASPRESLLGWYTTSHELNSFSALIQNFFASPETGTYPHPAVHLTVSTDPGADVQLKSYISAPVAVNAERAAESCFFIQVPHKVTYNDAERSALELISSAKDNESRTASLPSDVEGLARSLESSVDLLERVSGWISEILDEEREPNNALGQYLMSALSLAPKVDAASIEHDFNNHIQDVLMVSYLANSIRTQIDLSQRLATAIISDEKVDKEDGKEKGERGDKRSRGGRGGRGGGRGGREQREPREPREPAE